MMIPVAYVQVPLVDDYERRYPRPNVLEVTTAVSELTRLDELGALGSAELVRVLLAVVGRLGADGMAEAFPPGQRARRPLRVVPEVRL